MLYMCYINLNKDNNVGVRKKIKAQCRVFEKAFGTAYYTIFAGQTIYLLLQDRIVDSGFAITKQMCNDITLEWVRKYDIKRVYIRYAFSDIWFLDFLSELKKRDIKAVLEFPTIPYDGERGCPVPMEDRYYRERLCQYVDCCTTYADYKTVFNIPCISLTNGVDMKEHKAKQYREKDGRIILAAVAAMGKWHGYERVIQGMHEYYSHGGKVNIIFNLVGNGGQLAYYNRLVNEYKLCEHVLFCGHLEGENLNAIYDNSDIAVGSLGLYKTGIQSAAPIKLREYCARGIPFIYGYDDFSFKDRIYFGYQVPNDSRPIDLERVIEFYNRLYDGKDFIQEMRQYASQNLTWDKILQPVIDYLR